MKTQDRSSAIAKKSVAAGPAMGDRLPVPPRERKPALAALAVLLILVGALGATTLVIQAGDRVEAVKITERVPAGQPVPESAIAAVLVAEDPAVNYVPWSSRSQLEQDYIPSVDLVPGTVLVGEMLTNEETLGSDQVLVGLSLSAGRYPSGLSTGETVAAYHVGRDSGEGETVTGPTGTLVDRARVHTVEGAASGGDRLVTLRVSASDAADLARAGATGDVTLVVVPGSAD
ncbi:hypothetical protein [Streptomyces lonarensis]|uniref:SAF domain-containing protein n=1 Tax=Streptomyces lonarensis TaxID=700599 RepID=A0A7X6CY06_9ACTN|nr:hypothetical protein [Streptomyces lonarensis]NJQ04644.1 hypothetical protein [Streptomyces lonarensis]